MKKVHFDKFNDGSICCGTQCADYATTDVNQVTCRRCLENSADGIRTDDEHRRNVQGSARRIASIVCRNCKRKVHAYRAWGGRVFVTTSAGIALAVVGGIIGAGIGIATGGWGAPATIPLAAVCLVVGAGLGYIISDATLDPPTCPKCRHPINLGF